MISLLANKSAPNAVFARLDHILFFISDLSNFKNIPKSKKTLKTLIFTKHNTYIYLEEKEKEEKSGDSS